MSSPKIGDPRPSLPPIRPRDVERPQNSPPPGAPPAVKAPPPASGFDPTKSIKDALSKLGFGTGAATELKRNDLQSKPLPEVKDLQEKVNVYRTEHGAKPIKEDGFFGPKTEKAVKDLQKEFGLPETGRAGPSLETRLAVESDPSFKKLDDDTKKLIRTQLTAAGDDQAKLDNLKGLATAPGMDNLSPKHRQQLMEALNREPENADLAKGLCKLANSENFAKTSDATKSSLIDTIRTNGPVTDAKVDAALSLVGNPKFAALSDADKALVCEGFKGSKADPAFAQNVEKLLNDPKFDGASADLKTAVLSQVKNYPDARTVTNVGKALGKDWFKTQDLADQQRSLKLIGRLSSYDKGDRAIMDNTLNKFLDGDYKLVWKEYKSDGKSTTYGEGGDSTLWLNKGIVADGNAKMIENSKTNHLALSTTPHEVNHNINGDKVAKTYKYFEAEYRAWYVGFKAENGREPTNQEAMEQRLSWQLNPDSFYGKYAKEALKDPKEAQKFYDMLSTMSGQKVDAKNWETVIKSDASTWPDAAKPAPVPSGNITNS